MFQDRMKKLLNVLEANNQEIARYANCSPSSLSRLKNGSRKPKPNSPTIGKLIEGIIQYSVDKDYLQKLFDLIESSDRTNLDIHLRKWLYSDENVYSDKKKLPSFSENLSSMMSLTGLSNSRLAKLVNVDNSYISRCKSGSRSVKSNPELFENICAALFDQVKNQELFAELAELIHFPADSLYQADGTVNIDELYLKYFTFMNCFDTSNTSDIKQLLKAIDTFTQPPKIELPPLESIIPDETLKKILADTTAVYAGTEGLKQAVLRFLCRVCTEQDKELWLYSDQSMDWLLQDSEFHQKWAYLMALAISHNTHIKIIHNIDRDITELIKSVESWLPLYTSGIIESYYNKKNVGTRFEHTLFLRPGKACIAACQPKTSDKESRQTLYHYFTDELNLNEMENNFRCLMKESLPLVKTEFINRKKDNSTLLRNYNQLQLSITDTKVTIVKNCTPKLTMTFTHPKLINAFKSYIMLDE